MGGIVSLAPIEVIDARLELGESRLSGSPPRRFPMGLILSRYLHVLVGV